MFVEEIGRPIRNSTIRQRSDPKIRSDLLLRLLIIHFAFQYIYLELGHVVTFYLVNLSDFPSER